MDDEAPPALRTVGEVARGAENGALESAFAGLAGGHDGISLHYLGVIRDNCPSRGPRSRDRHRETSLSLE
ncbi:hypothetical protein GCM10014719_11470 [Planomonospora parontospora subsp. antibiotica]|nr:hypothetical protein GCM10014719_11470 [Planomonospora parontospora subsp. antibiotica]GII14861.1 hypothetical protein Ppa05_15870 [Planomonospora parontospora subsp. antibiotica]